MNKKKRNIAIIILSFLAFIALLIGGYFLYLKSTIISKEEVKDIIIKDTKLNPDDISFKEIELDLEKETKTYEVEFYYNRLEYKYEIDAKTGKIIYSNYNLPSKEENKTSVSTSYITEEEAKNIALEDAGLSSNEVSFVDIDLDLENNQAIYEVDFETATLEYDYKIDGYSKNIITKNTEPRD